jgi:preprotein translocase subunit YajC
MPQLLVFVLFFAGVYFLLLRPQQQRVRRQRELITAISVGDRVVTAGGLSGRVVDESDDRLWVEISDGVIAEFLRMAISRRLDDSEPGFGGTPDGGEYDEGDAYADTEADGAAEGGESEANIAETATSAAPEAATPLESDTPSSGTAAPVPIQPTQGANAGEAVTSETAAPAPGPDPH